MAKVTIYLSSVDRKGKQFLHLRDSNKTCADNSLVTEVSPGDTIVWKRDKESDLKSISGLNFEKGDELFSKKPVRGLCSVWRGIVKESANGVFPYHIAVETCNTEKKQENPKPKIDDEDPPPPPIIKTR